MKAKSIIWILALLFMVQLVSAGNDTTHDGFILWDDAINITGWGKDGTACADAAMEWVVDTNRFKDNVAGASCMYVNVSVPTGRVCIEYDVYFTASANEYLYSQLCTASNCGGNIWGSVIAEDGVAGVDNLVYMGANSDSVELNNWASGIWYNVTVEANHSNATIWKNDSLAHSKSEAGALMNTVTRFTFRGDGQGTIIDNIKVWAGTTDCFTYPSAGAPPVSPPPDYFQITLRDEWNGSSILNFSADINGTQYSTATGTINTSINATVGSLANIIIFNVTGYFNRTYLDYDTSTDLVGRIHQAEICINGSAKASWSDLSLDNITIGNNVTDHCFNITAGVHNALGQLSGWYNKNQSFTVTALTRSNLSIVNMSYANLTISAIDGTTNETLSNYDLYLNSITYPAFGELATGVTNYSFYLINDTYNITIRVPGYAVTTALSNVTVAGHTNYTFILYKSNSVTITIRDEITNNIITDNITIRWTSNATVWENSTDTGHLFVHNITPGYYQLLFYGSNYSTRTYGITVSNDSTQFLTAYMISSVYSTIFTIKDIDTGAILDNVSISMYKLINSTWTIVESKLSDISGKAKFYYDPIAHYRFYLSKTGYEDYIFYLNPILFSTYDVFMTRSVIIEEVVDYDDISLIYSPTSFDNNANVTFKFLISSPEGQLTDYSIKLTYPGGSDSDSGVNAIGEQLQAWVNITGATSYDRVKFEYNYTSTVSGERKFIQYLSINLNTTYNATTWLHNKDETYGLGIFERILITTIIIIFFVGISSMVGQPLPGVALGLFIFGLFVYIGFIPLWSVLPSILIGFLFLVWKSGGF